MLAESFQLANSDKTPQTNTKHNGEDMFSVPKSTFSFERVSLGPFYRLRTLLVSTYWTAALFVDVSLG